MRNGTGRLLVLMGALALLNGCGGGSGTGSEALTAGGGEEQTLTFGSLTTRVAGTVQQPMVAAGSGAVVTSVAGGLVTKMSLSDPSGTLAETKIAVSPAGLSGLSMINSDGTGLLNLPIAGTYGSISWSPDGQKLAATDGNYQIYTLASDGSGLTKISNNSGANDSDPDWSANNLIVFDSNRSAPAAAGSYEIYTMATDGSNVARLTTNNSDDLETRWSPDTKKIAFVSNRTGSYQIFTMDANGSHQQQLTTDSGSHEWPHWSPDGSKIVYSNSHFGSEDIFVMNADGSSPTRLTDDPAEDTVPCWSPDGSKILFRSNRSGSTRLYTMNPDGSGLMPVPGGLPVNFTAWSPFFKARLLLGTGGILGTEAGGFLFGQSGKVAKSVVIFDSPALSRKNLRVTADTGISPGIPNIVFTIAGDSLTSLKFAQTATWSPVTVIDSSGGVAGDATGAIVTFDASDGAVASVLPYTANRSASRAPSDTFENGQRVLRGKFLAVIDGKGKNQSPGGASEVRIDARTGKVLSAR